MPGAAADGVLVGLSGWAYPKWQGDFYPPHLPASKRLTFAAGHFPTLEINATFYSLQRVTSYVRWYDSTPEGFVFAVKGGRFMTHNKRLRDVGQGLANFFASGPLALREKLGPVLWQVPATLQFDPGLIRDFLTQLPRSTLEAATLAARHDERVRGGVEVHADADRPLAHALEVRHPSFDQPAFLDLAREFNVACVVSDSPTWPLFEYQTADFAYVRLHGASRLYASGYGPDAIDAWSAKVKAWAASGPVFVYFDNDIE